MHGKHGYMVLALAVLLSAIDILAGIRRFVSFVRSDETKSFRLFWNSVVLNKDINRLGTGTEYIGLVVEDPELDMPQISRESSDDGTFRGTARWAKDVHNHRRDSSLASEGTIFGSRSPTHSDVTFDAKQKRNVKSPNLIHRIGNGAFVVLERFLVFAGFAQLLTGIVIYTGWSLKLILLLTVFLIFFLQEVAENTT